MQNIPKCSSKELKIIGDFWSLNIIQSLNESEKRFSQLERDIEQINPTTLTNRLKRLEKEKLIKRKEETVDKLSVVYMLTERGEKVIPILKEIQKFANQCL